MKETSALKVMLNNRSVQIGFFLIFSILLLTVLGPFLTGDPLKLNPLNRLKAPSPEYFFGTDWAGRDVLARAVNGARVSLAVGIIVMLLSISFGLVLGLMAGYLKYVSGIIMRIMDGLMSIPAILLAISLVSIFGATLQSVIFAITFTEIPRVVRIVRSVVLFIREEAFVEAAIISGTNTPLIIMRHILPNTIPPLLVQGTFIIGSSIIIEALLGFLGAGIPPETPSWGNILAEGRNYFSLTPWVMFFPGFLITATVLGFNILGDGLRDALDPRIARKI